jgi:NDP-sugar pyrophosphorylase family protein
MMGDDMYGSDDIAELLKHQWAMEVVEAPGFATAADIEIDERGYMKKVDFDYEGKKETIMLDTGIYMMNKDIFNIELVQLRNGEYGLPHTLFKYIKDTNTPLFVHKAKHWIKMNNPRDLEKAEEYYLKIE